MKEYKNKVIFCFAMVALLFVISPLHRNLEEQTGLQWLFLLRGYIEPPHEVAVVALNNEASRRLGVSRPGVQWSRHLYAQLIDELSKRGAQLIVLDIAFKEARPEQDEVLAGAISRAGNVVLFNYIERQVRNIGTLGSIDIQQQLRAPENLLNGAAGSANFVLSSTTSRVVKALIYRDFGKGLEASLPVLALFLRHKQEALKVFAELEAYEEVNFMQPASFAHALNLVKRIVDEQPEILEKLRKNTVVPGVVDPVARQSILDALEHQGDFYINYFGPSGTVSTIPVDYLIGRNEHAERPNSSPGLHDLINVPVNGKVVFVGLSETIQTEQYDTYKTVFSESNGIDLSGVEILATVFSNLFSGRAILAPGNTIDIVVVMSFLVIAALSFRFLNFGFALSGQLLVYLMYCFSAYWMFEQNVWLPLFTPLLCLVLVNVAVLAAQFSASRYRNKLAVKAMSHYLPSHVAERITDNVDSIASQRQVVQGVCLMTDLHGFSSVSEQLEPEELHNKLNRYYDVLIQSVTNNNGHVANIVGDSLLALWTAPSLNREICLQSTNAAREMLLNLNRHDELTPYFATTSIGIHAGEFSLGNLGAQSHFEYAPVGDTVNTTARIEKLNRDLGTTILLSERVVSELDTKKFRFLGSFELRNRMQLVKLYDFYDDIVETTKLHDEVDVDYVNCSKDKDSLATEVSSLSNQFDTALEQFELKNIVDSRELFLKLYALLQDKKFRKSGASFKGPIEYYLSRCDDLLKTVKRASVESEKGVKGIDSKM